MLRTPRQWVETCRECGGSGKVHKREYFALYTPEECSQAIYLNAKHVVPPNAYVCGVAAGASIFEACKEGCEIAKAVKRPVAFDFNDKVAVCHGDSDPNTVAKVWWEAEYGKTYEQSVAER